MENKKLIERSEAELTAYALIEILAERDSQKALEWVCALTGCMCRRNWPNTSWSGRSW